METLEARFTLTQKEAIRLKFDNRLEATIKQDLCHNLAQQLMDSSHIKFIQHIHNNDYVQSSIQSQITFIARISVQKPQ